MPNSDMIDEPQRRRPGRPSLSNEELLDKALDLFLEKGFAGTSIDAICATAGMAKRTVYARYGDKVTLFKAALVRAIDDWIVPIDDLRAQETDDFEATLIRIGTMLVNNVLSSAGLRLMRLTNAESVAMPEIAIDNVRLGTDPTLQYLEDLFRRHLSKTREFQHAKDAAQVFLSLVVGGPANNAAWGMRMDAAFVDEHIRYSVRLFLYGIVNQADSRALESSPSLKSRDAGELHKALRAMDEALEVAKKQVARFGQLI